jgi:hypothetical protein
MRKLFLGLSVFLILFASSVFGATPTALLQVGTFKNMSAISVGDTMTPDHLPSGAAVVIACYLSNGNSEASIPTQISSLYQSSSSPYYHVYQKANTIVYDTAIHQQSSPTYGARNNREKIISDAKNLKLAFGNDKAVVMKALLASQKTRDGNNKPTNTLVTSQAVEAAFTNLNNLNVNSGIYDAASLKDFCKK